MALIRAMSGSSGGGGGTPFSFDNNTYITKISGEGPLSYTFTKAYDRCLVISAQFLYSASSGYALTFTGCTLDSTSEHFYGSYSNEYANCKAYIIKDVQVGATIRSADYMGFMVYSLD